MKLNKVLGSIFLIGLFSISFSGAFNIYPGLNAQQDFELGYSEEINNDGQGNYFLLQDKANLLLNDNLRVFKYGDNYKGGWLFWNNGKLYILVVRAGNISQQGFVNKFCVANYGKVATCGENDIDLFYNDGVKYSQPDSLYFWEDIQYTAAFSVCFGYSDLEYDVCFGNNYLGSGLNIGMGDLNNLSSLYGLSKFGNPARSPLPDVPVVNNIPCYSVGDLINSSADFNTGLCYSPNKIFSGGSLVSVDPKSILELFPSYNDFREGLDLYFNYCKAPATPEACQGSFDSNREGYLLINKLPSNLMTTDVYDLCSMYITYGEDQLVCELDPEDITPSYFNTEGYAELLRKGRITTVDSASGSVLEMFSGGDTSITGLFGLKQLFVNVSSFFSSYNDNSNGILPDFIIFAFVATVLFYLFKK